VQTEKPSAGRSSKRDQFVMGMAAVLVIAIAALVVFFVLLRPSSPTAYAGTVLDPPEDTPAFALTDQGGKPRQWSAYRGQVVVLTFLYTSCPDTCPLLAGKLTKTYGALGIDVRDVTFVAITVDPERDTPQAIQAFSEKSNMVGRWDYLTGAPDELAALWRHYGVGDVRREVSRDTLKASGDYTLAHKTPVHVIDKQGKDRIVYTDVFTPEGLTRDIRRLLKEK